VIEIQYNDRQKRIIEIVKEYQPVTSEKISNLLNVNRSTIRPDLSILVMTGILDARPKVGYLYVGDQEDKVIANHIRNVKVNELKSMPVVVDEKTTVYDAIVFMFMKDVGTIYVTSKGYLSGVVSRKDFLKTAIGGNDIRKIPVNVIMTRMPNLIIAFSNESIYEAAQKLINCEIDSLPVVERLMIDNAEVYKVVGRISKTSITKFFVELGTKEFGGLYDE